MSDISERCRWFFMNLNRMLLPEINLLPKSIEAVMYYISICILTVTSVVASIFPFSSYVEAISEFSGEEITYPLLLMPSVVAPLLILPGAALFLISQALSTSRRSWMLPIALIVSHFVLGSLVLLVVIAVFLLWKRRTGVAST